MILIASVTSCWYSDGYILCSSCGRFVFILLRKTLSDDKQAGVIVTFGLASGYPGGFLNIDNPCFEGVVSQVCHHWLQLNKPYFRYRSPLFGFTYIYIQLLVFA